MGTKSGSSKKRRDILKGRQAAQATPTPGPKVSVRKNHTADEVCREPLTENDLDATATDFLPRYFQLLYDLHVARDKVLDMNEQKTSPSCGTPKNSTLWLGELQRWEVTIPIPCS